MIKNINDLQRIIERTDWDNDLIKKELTINKACWFIAAAAIIFFSFTLFNMAIR